MQNGPLKMAAGLIRFNGDAVEGGMEGGVGGGEGRIQFYLPGVALVPCRCGGRARVAELREAAARWRALPALPMLSRLTPGQSPRSSVPLKRRLTLISDG